VVATTGTQLLDSMDTNIQGFQLLPHDGLRHNPTKVLYQNPHAAVLRKREGLKFTPSSPSRDRSALTAAWNPSTVDGKTINLSLFSWAVRPLGQDTRNRARKARVSRTPEIKIDVLLGRSHVEKQALAPWAWGVLQSGLSLIGPDMSLDMRLFAVSEEAAGSDMSESMAVGLSDPLG